MYIISAIIRISNNRGFIKENKNRKNLMIIIQTGKISRFSLTLFGETDFLKSVWANKRNFSGPEEGRLTEKFPLLSDTMFNL